MYWAQIVPTVRCWVSRDLPNIQETVSLRLVKFLLQFDNIELKPICVIIYGQQQEDEELIRTKNDVNYCTMNGLLHNVHK